MKKIFSLVGIAILSGAMLVGCGKADAEVQPTEAVTEAAAAVETEAAVDVVVETEAATEAAVETEAAVDVVVETEAATEAAAE